jgi:GT2 family glycosyltransferase
MVEVQLSIIIVNYNVRYFLEQALWAAQLAAKNFSAEIWVVDNNSGDQSVAMVRERFPEVQLIENADNPGFSRANNQAIRRAKGKYILLLNPDTIVGEDTFRYCYQFMEDHPDAGALGVRMLDGSGQFLPESKRGFPTPFVAFCKAFGLSRLFPKSLFFNRYHLGYLPESKNHEVEVLAGAFMWMRKSALDEVGLLDEDFFMYGEDIDLSYRFIQAGYKNYYLADTSIIHYKGESTKKGSLNYVRVFYKAMIIFAHKHFQGQQARFFVAFLNLAIYLRAAMTLLANWAQKAALPIIDALLLYAGLFWLKDFWGVYHFDTPAYFGRSFLLYNAPLYTLIWLVSLYFNGAYDPESSGRRILNGVLGGTIVIAAVYGFLNLEYRSSRMLILLGTFWALFALNVYRSMLAWWNWIDFSWRPNPEPRLIIVGAEEEANRVQALLGRVRRQKNLLGIVTPGGEEANDRVLGKTEDLNLLISRFRANEIIFCLQDLQPSGVIKWMNQLGPRITCRTIVPNASTIIGSSSKHTSGELYTVDTHFQLAEPLRQRSKRGLDLMLCLVLLILLPLLWWVIASPGYLYRHWWAVLSGRMTWIGYFSLLAIDHLPPIKTAVFPPAPASDSLSEKTKQQLNFFYAKDYHWLLDLRTFYEHMTHDT